MLTVVSSGITLQAATVAATATKVNGNVYAIDASGKSKKLATGDLISAGSLVHTNADSSVLIKLVPGATTVVTPGTDVVLTTLSYSAKSSGVKIRKITLTLKNGEVLCSLAKHDGHSDFRVITPMGTTKAIGTDWTVTFTPSSGVTVQTVDGVVEITLPGGKVISVPGGNVTTSPDGTIVITGTLTPQQIDDIKTALGGGAGSPGGGTFTITPVNKDATSNPANTSDATEVSPNHGP
jgi:hypothetical protein